MATTLAQLRTELRGEELRSDRTGKIFSDTLVNRGINKALFATQRAGNYKWQENDAEISFSSVSNQQEYSLTTLVTDFGRLRLVRFDGDELFWDTKVNIKRREKTFSTAQRPDSYYIYANQLGLNPIPTTVNTIDLTYGKILPELTTDSSLNPFPDDFNLALKLYTAYFLFKDVNRTKALEYFQDYQEEIENLQNIYIIIDNNKLDFRQERFYGNYGSLYVSPRAFGYPPYNLRR